jgi:VIT1/CCC1 family predicted Fe2+/Mn2+ transporter
LPNPSQAAATSALAFSIGAMVSLLPASFIKDYEVRVVFVLGAVSFISSIGVQRVLTHADIRRNHELTHVGYIERELTHI